MGHACYHKLLVPIIRVTTTHFFYGCSPCCRQEERKERDGNEGELHHGRSALQGGEEGGSIRTA